MTQHIADNHEALLAYLYEEGDPAERLTVARHLQECAPCSVAVLEFQNVRGMLHDWTPPATELGFRIVQEKPAVLVPPRAFSFWPPAYGGWARAAAAVLVFAAGMAVSQFTMSYDAWRAHRAAAPARHRARAESATRATSGLSLRQKTAQV
jgi:anti-sigma factor RsiW